LSAFDDINLIELDCLGSALARPGDAVATIETPALLVDLAAAKANALQLRRDLELINAKLGSTSLRKEI